MRGVKHVIRRGRVTKIVCKDGSGASISFQDGKPLLVMDGPVVFVHCASPGPFNGEGNIDIFVSDQELNLHQLIIPPVCTSSAMIAMIETARREGKLDLEFEIEAAHRRQDGERGARCLQGVHGPGRRPAADRADGAVPRVPAQGRPRPRPQGAQGQPAVDAEHPGAKVEVYEDRGKYAAKSDVFKLSAGYTKILTALQAQLKLLEGK